MPPFPLLYYAQKNSNSTPPNKSKDHCVKNNVHFYNKKWNVSWRWKNLSYYHVTTVAVLFCYFRCCLLYSVAISLSSVVACRNISVLLMNVVQQWCFEQCSDCRSINVIHQSFNLREGVDRFKVVELKKSGIRGHCSVAYLTIHLRARHNSTNQIKTTWPSSLDVPSNTENILYKNN